MPNIYIGPSTLIALSMCVLSVLYGNRQLTKNSASCVPFLKLCCEKKKRNQTDLLMRGALPSRSHNTQEAAHSH